jgi:hypothetical protein
VRDLRSGDDPLVFTVVGGRHADEALAFSLGADGRADRANLAGYPMVRVDLVREPTW